MSWTKKKDELQTFARSIDKSVILVTKNHWFWRAIGAIPQFLHLMSKEEFLKHYATTLGPVQAYPEDWLASTVEEVLVHESEHTAQARKFGLWISPWLGLPIQAIFYLFIFFPVFLAYFRYRMELGADLTRWKWMLEQGILPAAVLERANDFAEIVASSRYGWSLRKSWIYKGFKNAATKLIYDRYQQEAIEILKKYESYDNIHWN